MKTVNELINYLNSIKNKNKLILVDYINSKYDFEFSIDSIDKYDNCICFWLKENKEDIT